jgi:putative SOS response-associated peptidase YedK
MCFSYSVNIHLQNKPTQETLAQAQLNLNPLHIPQPGFFLNGFSHPELPIFTSSQNSELAIWGLIPTWAQPQQISELQKLSLNARSETAADKPMFKNAWLKNPCLIPASGFFEWKHQGKTKIPHFIFPKNQEILFFGGLFSDYKHPTSNQWQRSFTILTTSANPFMADIHNTKHRMPVIIEPQNATLWLNGSMNDREFLTTKMPHDFLTAFTVNPNLNKPSDRNFPWAIQPFEHLTLF